MFVDKIYIFVKVLNCKGFVEIIIEIYYLFDLSWKKIWFGY